jgi:hypothetical protein
MSRRRGLLALASLVVLSAVLRALAAGSISAPWISPDELLYALLARSLGETGRLQVLGHTQGFYSLVYPALIALPLSLDDVGRGYAVAKDVGAVAISLTAVPVYLWGRTLMRPGWALVAAALTLASGALVYSSMLMTEVAFVPILTLVAWATARALERPGRARLALLVGGVLLACLTRLQALVLGPAVLTAVALYAGLARDRRVLRPFAPLGALAVVAVALGALRGSASLGAYSTVVHGGYGPGAVAEYVAYHAAGLLLACGVVPLCSLVPLSFDAVRGRLRTPEARALVAVAVSFSVWIVLQVGVFASEYARRIVERDLVGLAPVLFLCLCLWLDRGAARSYPVAAGTAFAAAALLVVVPYGRFVADASSQDSPTFAAALRVLHDAPGIGAFALVATPALVLAIAFALVPRRGAAVLAGAVFVAVACVSVGASREYAGTVLSRQLRVLGQEPRWIDRAGPGPTAYVYSGGFFFNAVWENAFWNRAVRAVYDMPGAVVDGPMPQQRLQLRGDGVLRAAGRPIPYRYAVLPDGTIPAGEEVAHTDLVASDILRLVLWRLDGTPRILEQRAGFSPNGDVPYRADVREYGCDRGGTFSVTFFGKTTTQTVTLLLDGRPVRTIPLTAEEGRTELVHAPPTRGTCTLTLKPSTLVGTTTISFGRG